MTQVLRVTQLRDDMSSRLVMEQSRGERAGTNSYTQTEIGVIFSYYWCKDVLDAIQRRKTIKFRSCNLQKVGQKCAILAKALIILALRC